MAAAKLKPPHREEKDEPHLKVWTPDDWYIRVWATGAGLWHGFAMDFEGALFGDPMVPAVFATDTTPDQVKDQLRRKLHAMDVDAW